MSDEEVLEINMPYKFESEVLKALEKLLKTETNYDVIIHVGKESDTKEFHAHSGFLCCRSDYFNSILSTKDTIKKDGKYVINKPNITPQAFDVIIKYFYTGHINMSNNTGVEILNMMTAFDDLKLNQLIKLAEDFLIAHHQNFLKNDPIKILQMVYSYKIFNNIQRLCLQNIYSKPNILFNSVKFVNLPAPLLEIILKQDDLILDEIEIWENLIKWGLAKDKILDEHVSKWNQEKFNIFERILHNFIPLIRFYDISSEDYFNKVRPYEQILSKELREDILKFHMVPGFKSSFNNYTKRHSKRNHRQHPNPNQKRNIDYSDDDFYVEDTEYEDNDRQLEHPNPNPYPNPNQYYMDDIPQAMGQLDQNFQNMNVDYFERPEQYRRQNYSNYSTRGFSQVKDSWNYRT